MARTERKYPIPKIEKRGTSFRLRWYAQKTQYEITLKDIDKHEANSIRSQLEAAFAKNSDVPEKIRHEPAIKRFFNNFTQKGKTAEDDLLIDKYVAHLKSISESQWPERVEYYLNKALTHNGTLQNITPAMANDFLDMLSTGGSPSVRNRAHVALSGFFKWLRLTYPDFKNFRPLEGIRKITEERRHDGIIIWEHNEIPQLLQAADNLKHGIAIWIAILAGLRRSEIARLEINDITPAYILIQKSKNRKKRQVPLSAALARKLESLHIQKGSIVHWPENYSGWVDASYRLVNTHLPKLLPEIHKNHPEKFGWNAFRHTFASRHAQAGMSLDVIAAWMGNTPTICKEHYARHVPANMRDTRIDLIDDIIM